MNCFHCQNSIDGKSFIHLTGIATVNEEDKTILIDKHICGYPCFKRLSESNSLPRDLWSHIVNKEDYEGIIMPIISLPKKSFEYLSFDEIQRLNDTDKEKYFREKENQIHLNPELSMIHEEMNEEDERVNYLEEMSSDSDIQDDYY